MPSKSKEIEKLNAIIAAQQERIHQLESIIALMPGHVYWKSTEGIYLGCNDNQVISLGLQKSQDIIGKTDFDFVLSKSNAEEYRKNDLAVIQSGLPKSVEERARVNGKDVIVFSQKVPLRDKHGEITGVLGISFDITNQKLKESELVAEKEKAELTLEHIIAHMPGHVYWKDREGIYLGCNDLQAKTLGFSTGKDMVGKTDFDLAWKDQAAALRQADLEVITTGVEKTVEELVILNQAQQAIFLSKKLPLRDKKGRIIGVLGVSFDITERKQQEEQKAAFLTVVSHEIRGPLTNIQGLTQSLKIAKNANEQNIELIVDDIASEVKRATNLLADIVDLFDPNFTKDNTLYVDDVNLAEVIDSIIPEVNFTPETKFIAEINSEVPGCININVIKLRNIIKILLQNSAEQTKQGFIKIVINTINKQNRSNLYIELFDTSSNIYPPNEDYVFNALGACHYLEKDFLYHKPYIKLTMAKRLIESMNGTISLLTHSSGKGSEFEVVIPYQLVSFDQPVTSNIQAPLKSSQTNRIKIPAGLKILVVEDDYITNQLLANMFNQFKCKVKQVYTGQDALRSIENQKYDLVSLDITLPDISGMQILEKLPQDILPAVIAITSYATKTEIDYLYNQGFIAVLTKPVSQEDIENLLQTYTRVLQEN